MRKVIQHIVVLLFVLTSFSGITWERSFVSTKSRKNVPRTLAEEILISKDKIWNKNIEFVLKFTYLDGSVLPLGTYSVSLEQIGDTSKSIALSPQMTVEKDLSAFEETFLPLSPTNTYNSGIYTLTFTPVDISQTPLQTAVEFSTPITLVEGNFEENKFKGDCNLDFTYCILSLLFISTSATQENKISLKIEILKKDDTNKIAKVEAEAISNETTIPITEAGNYSFAIYSYSSVLPNTLLAILENVELVNLPEFEIQQTLFIGQSITVSFTSKVQLTQLYCADNSTDIKKVEVSYDKVTSVYTFPLTDSCNYLFTNNQSLGNLKKYNTISEIMFYTTTLCHVKYDELSLTLTKQSPFKGSISISLQKGIQKPQSFIYDDSNSKFTLTTFNLNEYGEYSFYFYYDTDKMSFHSDTLSITNLIISKNNDLQFSLQQLSCFPSLITINGNSEHIECRKDTNPTTEMICSYKETFTTYGKLTVGISGYETDVDRYKSINDATFSVLNPVRINYKTGETNLITIQSEDFDLTQITKISIQKMDETNLIDYIKENSATFKFNCLNSKTITFTMEIGNKEWYYIHSLYTSDASLQFKKTKLIESQIQTITLTPLSYFYLPVSNVAENLNFNIQFENEIVATNYNTQLLIETKPITCTISKDDPTICTITYTLNHVSAKIITIELSGKIQTSTTLHVYTYSIPSDYSKCQGGQTTESTFSDLDFTLNLPETDQSQFSLRLVNLLNPENVITPATPSEGNVYKFSLLQAQPGKYIIKIVRGSDTESVIDESLIIKLLLEETIQSIGEIFASISTKQFFVITFKNAIEDRDSIQFTLSSVAKTPVVFDCKRDDTKKQNFDCVHSFNQLPRTPKYKLSWINGCNTSSNHDSEISLSNNILSPTKPFKKQKENNVLELSYTKEISNEDVNSIILVDINNNENKTISLNDDNFHTDLPKTITIEINPSFTIYHIITKYENGDELEDGGNTLIIFEKNIELTKLNQVLKTGVPINNFVIPFKNSDIYPGRFSSVNLNEGKYDEYEIVDSVVKLTNTLMFDHANSPYSFTFTDAADNTNTQTYEITVVQVPTSATLSPTYYYDTPIEIAFNFEFDNTAGYYTIRTSDGIFTFTIANESDPKKATLRLNQTPEGDYLVENKLQVLFFEDVIIRDLSLIILNSDTFPHTIPQKFITIRKNIKKFGITFNEYVFNEFLNQIKVKEIGTAQETPCTITTLAKKSMTIEVTCDSITDTIIDYKISVTSFEVDLTDEEKITLKIINCDEDQIEYQNVCKRCEEIDENKPYVQGTECVDKCAEGFAIYKGACIDCIAKKIFFNTEKTQCLDECPIVHKDSVCYSGCQSKLDDIYYREGKKCVKNCSTGYLINSQLECFECDGLASDKYCSSQCPPGTIKGKESCEVIQEVTKCPEDYCDKNGSSKCNIVNKKPICECKSKYYGVTCELIENKMQEATIITISTIFPKTEYENISFRVMSSIFTVSNLFQNNESLIENVSITSKKVSDLAKKALKDDGNLKQAFTVVCFSLQLLGLRLKHRNNKNLRLLTDDTDKESIKDILKEMNFKVSTLAKTMTTKTILLKDDTNPVLFYQIWKSKDDSIKQMEKEAADNNLSVIDFGDSFAGKDYTIIKQELSASITQVIDNTLTLNSIQLQIYDKTTSISLSNLEGTAKVKLDPSSDMDYSNFLYYYDRGIDVYNPNSPAFTEDCYFNKQFDYDLVQEFRKFGLFQNKTITSNIDGCIYSNFSVSEVKVILKCDLAKLNNGVGYKLSAYTIPDLDHHDENLPTMCGKSIDKIKNNFGFWINLWLIIIFIVLAVAFVFLKSKGIIFSTLLTSLENEAGNTNGEHKSLPVETQTSGKNVDPNDIVVHIPKSFGQIIANNFLTLHPLLSSCHDSFTIQPLSKLSLLFFNMIILFGFNALFYNEGIIDKLRFRKDFRNNFGYPMRYEFYKIMYTILVTIGLNILLRLITLVTLNEKHKLHKAIEDSKNYEEKNEQL